MYIRVQYGRGFLLRGEKDAAAVVVEPDVVDAVRWRAAVLDGDLCGREARCTTVRDAVLEDRLCETRKRRAPVYAG